MGWAGVNRVPSTREFLRVRQQVVALGVGRDKSRALLSSNGVDRWGGFEYREVGDVTTTSS